MTTKFPCATDLAFYQARRMPRWAWTIKTPEAATIDSVVNAHGSLRVTSGECAVQNLLMLLRGGTRRGIAIEKILANLATHPACAISPEKRAAFARKWAARLGVTVPPHEAY